VVFVEKSPIAAATLRDNIVMLGASTTAVNQVDATDYLHQRPQGEFDIVFLDPPFAADLHEDLCRLLVETKVLSRNAWIYLEEDKAKPAATLPEAWQIVKTRNAGNVRYSLVQTNTQS